MNYLAPLPALIACCTLAQAEIQTEFPWSKDIPADIARQFIEPTQLIDEKPCDWREQVQQIFLPVIKDCKTAEEAVQAIAPNMGKLTGVYYSVERSAACLNPEQSLREKKASCTGLSILFAAAMRSVGIPARLVGVLSWNHTPGNHTWTEVWFDGAWHMIEFDQSEYNTAWVMDAVSMLDTSQWAQRVMALCPETSADPMNFFPLPWNIANHDVRAEDVSARYMQLACEWYATQDKPKDKQELMIDLLPRPEDDHTIQLCDSDGKVLSEGLLPKPKDDMRQMLKLYLPKTGSGYYLKFSNEVKIPVSVTNAPVQVLRFKAHPAQ